LHTDPSTTKPGSKFSGIIRSGPEALPVFQAAAVAYSKVFSETKDQMRAPTLGDRVDRLAHFVFEITGTLDGEENLDFVFIFLICFR